MTSKNFFKTLFLALALLWNSPTHAATVDTAKSFINSLGSKAIGIASSGSMDKQKLSDLEQLFITNVDINWVGKFVLSGHWRTLTEDQKKRYIVNYQNFVIKHYTSHFTDYTRETFKVTNARDDGGSQYTVTMHIMRPGKEDLVVDYRVHQSEGGALKIFDIIVEGVSLITTQRSEFSSVVERKGINYLIDQLGAKAAAVDPKNTGK